MTQEFLPTRVRITEVGLRDGLQLEKTFVPTERKIALGRRLIDAGLTELESTTFVARAAVPQFVDAPEVVAGLKGHGARISALAPNARGCEAALAAGVDAVTAFVSASESHNRKNLNRPIADSLVHIAEMAALCRDRTELTAAISTSFGCPFEGDIQPAQVARIAEALLRQGIRRISLGDTTGMATPPVVRRLYAKLAADFPEAEFILHFHNTRGLGLVNVMTGLQLGATRFESSIGGLGGCPFAPGATGNVATDDLVHMLDELGLETGVRLDRLLPVTGDIEQLLGRRLESSVARAGPRLTRHDPESVVTAKAKTPA